MVGHPPRLRLGNSRFRLRSKRYRLSLHSRSPPQAVGPPDRPPRRRHRHGYPNRSPPPILQTAHSTLAPNSHCKDRLDVPPKTSFLGLHHLEYRARSWLLLPCAVLTFICYFYRSKLHNRCPSSSTHESCTSRGTVHLRLSF